MFFAFTTGSILYSHCHLTWNPLLKFSLHTGPGVSYFVCKNSKQRFLENGKKRKANNNKNKTNEHYSLINHFTMEGSFHKKYKNNILHIFFFSKVNGNMSRLHLWMKPIYEQQQRPNANSHRQDSLGSFEEWSDDHSDDPRLLQPLGGGTQFQFNNNGFMANNTFGRYQSTSIQNQDWRKMEQQQKTMMPKKTEEKKKWSEEKKKPPPKSPVKVKLRERKAFCCLIDNTECRRCQQKRLMSRMPMPPSLFSIP